MTAAALVVLALSMSMDAFAAAVAKGAALRRPSLAEALRTGMIFGLVEALTPVIGWLIGAAAAVWIAQVDHWVAFAILSLLGLRMVWGALHAPSKVALPERHSLPALLATAVGTSLDAMAVGVTLACIGANIVSAALSIGLATFLMTSLGTMVGRWIGPLFGRAAELVGGLCLIGIGTTILLNHLAAG